MPRETEDLAQDAADAIQVEYEVLPFASTLKDTMAPDAAGPARRKGESLAARRFARQAFRTPPGREQQGDLDKGFAEADVIKEFTYHFAGAVSVPMQPSGSVAKWDGDRLTFWGMGQGIYPARGSLRHALGIDPSKIRFINKWNGSTFGAARLAAERFYPLIAHLAKVTGRPVKVMLPKDQELAQLQIKPETITKFKVGAKKDGRITAIEHDGLCERGRSGVRRPRRRPGKRRQPDGTVHVAGSPLAIVVVRVSDQRAAAGTSRSYYQQETKWSWESMMDEMAEALGKDPVEFRLMHITRPKPGDTRYPYDSFPSVEVLTKGAKAFGWDKRNPVAGGSAGTIQARIRPGNVAASWRPDGLSRRRGSFRQAWRRRPARICSARNWNWRPTAL